MGLGERLRRHLVTILVCALALAFIVIVVLLLRGVDLSQQVQFARDYAAVAGAVIALTSLVTVTFATWMNWRATRRQATLDAWSKWSDDTASDRALISKSLGLESLTQQQAENLLQGNRSASHADAIPSGESVGGLTPDEWRVLVHAVAKVLNGLERLAVGVELGVYRRTVLIDVGGTIIKRNYERFEPYITLRRSNAEKIRRQEKAYVALERLAHRIRYNEVDAERLKSLRRQL